MKAKVLSDIDFSSVIATQDECQLLTYKVLML